MIMKNLGVCILGLLLFFPVVNTVADSIVIAGDSWCPFNCDPETDKQPGYMVEIAKMIFAKNGHSLKYTVLPWKRAVVECRQGKITGVIGGYLEDTPDFIFPHNELAMIGFSFFVPKNSLWTYKDVSSLSKIKLGVINGYAYNQEIDDYIAENQDKLWIASGEKPLMDNIKSLTNGYLDVIIESDPVFWFTAAKMGLRDRFQQAGTPVAPRKAYIAFSPAISKSKAYAQMLSDGIDAMRKSGELKNILDKYGLKDWK
jgi:polar amino acid transport system substrate-binding protein